MSDETRDILVCSVCAKALAASGTATDADWLALEAVAEVEGDVTEWRCPKCGKGIAVMLDYGEIDFGVEPGG